MYKILENNLNNLDKDYSCSNSKHLVKMCSQAKTSGTKLLEVHGVDKSLNPNLRLEKQHAIPKQGKSERLWMGQGRAGSKRRKPDPISQAINQPSKVSKEIPGRTKIVTGKTNSANSTNSVSDRLINNTPFMPDVSFHPGLLLRNPKQQPIKQNIQEINPKINFDFEENSPFQEGIMLETFQRPDKSYFQNPKELGDLINKENLVHKSPEKETTVLAVQEMCADKIITLYHKSLFAGHQGVIKTYLTISDKFLYQI